MKLTPGTKVILRVSGNFGLSFLIPLGSISIGDEVFNVSQSLESMVLKSFVVATVYTGISIFREMVELGSS